MIAGNRFVASFVASFVTRRLGAKTHCHDNFGYGFRNCMIPEAVTQPYIGPLYAFER